MWRGRWWRARTTTNSRPRTRRTPRRIPRRFRNSVEVSHSRMLSAPLLRLKKASPLAFVFFRTDENWSYSCLFLFWAIYIENIRLDYLFWRCRTNGRDNSQLFAFLFNLIYVSRCCAPLLVYSAGNPDCRSRRREEEREARIE